MIPSGTNESTGNYATLGGLVMRAPAGSSFNFRESTENPSAVEVSSSLTYLLLRREYRHLAI
jgi:hypothetical protein